MLTRDRDIMIGPLNYLRKCLEVCQFRPYQWDGEDRNIGAFRSREELAAWYCQPPAPDGTPYRDRGFYTRELAAISLAVRPRVVVEFGTSLGIGTCLLGWLNPDAALTTVDNRQDTFMPGNRVVPIGHMAQMQGLTCDYVCGDSWDYTDEGVDLCFVDADHSYAAVVADSTRAWWNRSDDGHPWAILWHDHNERHPGVVRAVAEFCGKVGVELQSMPDSDTVWIMGDGR